MAVLLALAVFLAQPAEALEDVAAEAGVDAQDLPGAGHVTALDPRPYLQSAARSRRLRQAQLRRQVACVIRYESGGNPRALNPQRRSRPGNSCARRGLPRRRRQPTFGLRSVANRAAIVYMLQNGQAREFR